MPKKIDLTGQRFGRLTVMYEAEPKYTSGGNRKVVWHCKCDCGNEKDISSSELRKGYTKSCGCYNRDVARERMHLQNKKYNKYDLTGEYGIGWDSKGNEFWFDLEDYELIRDYCWHKHRNYFEATDTNHKNIFLHKLIMNDLENQYDIDRIDTLNHQDNRKQNLRKCTRRENNRNCRLQKNNKSGVCGVKWHKRDKIWESVIRVNYKDIYLGRFDDFNLAVEARKKAEERYFGEWSFDNSQKIAKERNLIEEVI